MALQPSDQFYLQRPLPGSKQYDKVKTTVRDVEQYITSGITTDYNDLSDRLDQEIIDRIEGDDHLSSELEGLTQRLGVIGAEIYNIVAKGKFKYRISQQCKNTYQVLINGCNDPSNGFADHEADACRSQARSQYMECIASAVNYDSRGGFYLESDNYEYNQTKAIFVSSIDDDGINLEYTELAVGDYVEIVGTKVLDDGSEVLDNFNYAIYLITGADYETSVEENGLVETLTRFDLEYKAHVGVPKVNTRFVLNFMVNMERELGKSYVKRSGDIMYGPLDVNITDTSALNGLLQTGINSRNRVNALTLSITGTGSRGFSNFFPDLVFTSLDDVNIDFNTSGKVSYNYGDASQIAWTQKDRQIIGFYESEGDPDDADNFTPAYLKFSENLIFDKVAEYVSFPNLTSPAFNKPSVIAPKGYVDLMDDALDAKITDINNRIDTLANASDTFRYDMIVSNLIEDCTTALGDPPGTLYSDGTTWATCVADKIQEEALAGTGGGLFAWTGPFEQPYTDEDGNQALRDVDFVVLDHRASLYEDPDMNMVEIDWVNSINIGDYFEISTTALRNTAYGVWRCTDKITRPDGHVILAGVVLYKSEEEIIQGYIYKFKKYDKTSGLTLDDVDGRFVKIVGDTMTGHLDFKLDYNNATPIIKVINSLFPTETFFRVRSNGEVSAPVYEIIDTRFGLGGNVEGRWTTKELEFKPRGVNDKVIIKNTTGQGIRFVQGADTPLLTLTSTYGVNAHDREVINVLNPTSGKSAANWNWMHAYFSGAGGISLSTNSQSGAITWSMKELYLNDLGDVTWRTAQNAWDNGLIMVWNKSKQVFEESTAPYKPFKPGNKVATTNSSDSNLQQYGFYFNESTGQLFLKV